MSERDDRYNRDEDQKPGRPPRPATEPPGAERSTRTRKTLTDPGSGEPHPTAQRPNRSQTDETADR